MSDLSKDSKGLTDLDVERLLKSRIWAQGEIHRARADGDLDRIVELELLREEASEMLEDVPREQQERAMRAYLLRLQDKAPEVLH